MSWENNFKKYDTSEGYGNRREWKRSFYQRISLEDAIEILEAQDETPYTILGVHKNATQAEIKKAFFTLIKKWHPDNNPDQVKLATEQSQKIIAAYTILKT